MVKSSVRRTISVKRYSLFGGTLSVKRYRVGYYKYKERSSVWGLQALKRKPRSGGLQA